MALWTSQPPQELKARASNPAKVFRKYIAMLFCIVNFKCIMYLCVYVNEKQKPQIGDKKITKGSCRQNGKSFIIGYYWNQVAAIGCPSNEIKSKFFAVDQPAKLSRQEDEGGGEKV
jgi:hypothetical protein